MNRRPMLVLSTALLLCALACSAKTVYVKWDSPGPTFDGTSWATAFHKVQDGLNASVSGDEVWVAKGTYIECITLKDGVGLYGGFAGDEGVRDQRNPLANETSMDGNGLFHVVTSPSGVTSTAVFDGFTIRNSPGAVNCYLSSPTITNNRFMENKCNNLGAAICCHTYASPLIMGNTMIANSAPYGGAIDCSYYSSPRIIANTFALNTATKQGGAISCRAYSSPSIIANLITDNSAAKGGGICCYDSAPVIAGNTIARNSAQVGGAIFVYESSPYIGNNTMVLNSSVTCGGIYSIGTTSSVVVANNILASNSSGIYRYNGEMTLQSNCLHGNAGFDYQNISPGTGDLLRDPLLIDRTNGDFHLRPDSPCINAGSSAVPHLHTTDIDGQARIQFDVVDIGADEVPSSVCSIPEARSTLDSASANLSRVIVTAVFGGCFYTETDGRSTGMRISRPYHGVHVGDRVSVTGTVATNTDGERYVDAQEISLQGLGAIAAVGLPNTRIGGTDWYHNPVTGSGQSAITEWKPEKTGDTWTRVLVNTTGLNNVGLLISTTGRVTYIGDVFFYLDDGSHLDDGSGHIGVRVALEGQSMPALDSYLKVTGVSSCYKREGSLFRLVRATAITQISR